MERLTLETHSMLYKNGYRYFFLKGVDRCEQTNLTRYILQPLKNIPAVLDYSCIGINDGMIFNIISEPTPTIHIYFEALEDFASGL